MIHFKGSHSFKYYRCDATSKLGEKYVVDLTFAAAVKHYGAQLCPACVTVVLERLHVVLNENAVESKELMDDYYLCTVD